jgi:hypothetical protein
MVAEEFICAICRQIVKVDKNKLEVFVPNRIWGAELNKKIHSCGHESVFIEGEPAYSAFFIKKNDRAAELISKYELSKWKGKVYFHFLEEGVQNKDEFKKILKHLLEEIDFIFKDKKITDPEDKARLIIQDKLEGYRERIKTGKFERERLEFVPDHEA